MNASFGCKGEIHLEVVEMFPSRRGSLSLGSKETSPSLSEFAGAFLVIAFPVAQEDGEAVGARVFQHLVAAAVLCCHAQRVQNLCFDGGEHDGEFGWGVADDDRAFHRSCTLFVLGQEDADRRVVAYHFGIAATDHGGAAEVMISLTLPVVLSVMELMTGPVLAVPLQTTLVFFSWLRRS